MLSKWFKRKSVPTNDGKLPSSGLDKHHYIKVYELELSNMEETPVYELKHQLSIGSEIGNIIISDPSVSPRHASFILQQDVVSVMDHGSVAGTLINGTKIPAGKYIILEETDVVSVGDLEIKLRVGTVSAPVEEIPEVPEEVVEEIEEEVEEIVEEPKAAKLIVPPKKAFNPQEHLKSNKKKKKPLKISGPIYSANALVRVLAVLSDLLLSYAVLVVFLPFDDFRNFLDFVPSYVASLLDLDWGTLWAAVIDDHKFIGEMLSDVYKFFSSTFHFLPLFIIFVLNRLITTILFGVSFSELALGMRGTGNGIWKRVGGVLRVLLGLITWPFVIFDLPAVVSRRTLKEFLTFTNTATPSKLFTIAGIVIYIPLMFTLALVSPLLQGLETPEAQVISGKIDSRVKVEVPALAEGEVAPLVKEESSRLLQLQLEYDPNELRIIPNVKFTGIKTKINLKTGLIFYQRDQQKAAEFEVFKKFDFRQLLEIGIKGNFFLYDDYPNIYNYVYSAAEGNPSFKIKINESTNRAFAEEIIKFMQLVFSISPESAPQIMQEKTPLLKGPVDFKAAFLSLIEYKEFDQLNFIQMGNAVFMKVSFKRQKPFDLIIPLMRGEGHIYRLTLGKKEDARDVSNKFYKYNMDKSNWLPESVDLDKNEMSGLKLFDLYSNENLMGNLLIPQTAQSFYAFYFENSSDILKKKDAVELEIWKDQVVSIYKILETIPQGESDSEVNATRLKLLQNFGEIIDALENKNLEYFGISESTSI